MLVFDVCMFVESYIEVKLEVKIESTQSKSEPLGVCPQTDFAPCSHGPVTTGYSEGF